ncbi:hypothetical protein COU77_01595 [Candidatus Peregrinibacteria bacterium CG10_big_fil_rev_8_21_14_0_10_49_16]|nr:MAG: hypothetical protein COU77_01595 [Candidatus Peregrinibacteria bacterium CG10_big_fil_rev_8_21_14_0_10_49_16]
MTFSNAPRSSAAPVPEDHDRDKELFEPPEIEETPVDFINVSQMTQLGEWMEKQRKAGEKKHMVEGGAGI